MKEHGRELATRLGDGIKGALNEIGARYLRKKKPIARDGCGIQLRQTKGGAGPRRASGTVSAVWQGPFSKSARRGAPPVVSLDVQSQTRVPR